MEVDTWENSEPVTKTHLLPISIILFHMVDYSRIRSLPLNQDCTQLLHSASIRALDTMFPDGIVSVEFFMPRHQEFQMMLENELAEFRRGNWQIYDKSELMLRLAGRNDNSGPKH